MKRILLLVLICFGLTACSQSTNIMSGYEGFNKKDHHYVTKNYNEIIDDLENYVPGLYYMGFAQCPWCQDLVPVLEEQATEHDIKITYLNTRDEKYKADTEAFDRLTAWIEKLPKDSQNDSKVPFLISIASDKTVSTHLGTAPNHDATKNDMTEAELNYLNARLTELIKHTK